MSGIPQQPGMRHHEPSPTPEDEANEIVSSSPGHLALPQKIAEAIRNAQRRERDECRKIAEKAASEKKSADDVAREIRSRG